MHEHDKQIPIWFFIGILLTIYGILILGVGVHEWMRPPAIKVALWSLHADVWWGIVLIAIGTLYVVKQRPGRTPGS
jgi:hypothetical protein